MATKPIGADAAKLAGLQMDFLGKLRKGHITLETFEQFLRGELVRKSDGTSVVKKRPKPGQMSWGGAHAYLYDLLGMLGQYEEFRKEHPVLEWQVVMLKGLTYHLVAKLHRRVKVGLDLRDDLNEIEEQRDPNRDGSYMVLFKAAQEADPENANQSANDRQNKNCQDITVLERLFMGLIFFLVSGRHLDEQNITLCSGSRYPAGSVLLVRQSPGGREVCVYSYYSHLCHHYLRARSVECMVFKSAVSAT